MAKGIVQFLQEVRAELAKVEWPDKQEFIGSTVVVLVLVCLFMVYFGVVDLGISRVAKYVFAHYSSGY